MSEFGNLVKNVMNDLDKRTSIETKERKEKTVTYKIEASGIDMAVTRVLNGKDTRTLILILSQTDNEGKPVILMKEKDKVLEVTESSLRSFLDGADPGVPTGCTAVPYLRKGKEFIETFWSCIHSPNFIKLAKLGVMDLECIIKIIDSGYNACDPWFVEMDSYKTITRKINSMDENMFNNIHPKLVKFAVNYMMDTFNLPYHKALQYVYGNNEGNGYYRKTVEVKDGYKYVTNSALTAFVVLANRYDEPFALQCMDEYYNDMNLQGLTGSSLDTLLRIKTDCNLRKDYYGSCNAEYAGVSLIRNSMKQGVLDRMAVTFEKKRLWEYILNATCVGKGRDLNGYVTSWRDYIAMALVTDRKIKDKYPEYLQVAHDKYSEKYDVVKDSIEETGLMEATKISSAICDVNTKEYQFRVLRTPQAFCDEASENSNCVASYVTKCSMGASIVGSFRKRDAETTQLTVELSPNDYKMIQIRGKYNRLATDEEMVELNKIAKKIQKRWEKYIKAGNFECLKNSEENDEEQEEVKEE